MRNSSATARPWQTKLTGCVCVCVCVCVSVSCGAKRAFPHGKTSRKVWESERFLDAVVEFFFGGENEEKPPSGYGPFWTLMGTRKTKKIIRSLRESNHQLWFQLVSPILIRSLEPWASSLSTCFLPVITLCFSNIEKYRISCGKRTFSHARQKLFSLRRAFWVVSAPSQV